MWLDDQGWWAGVVEFQPSAWSRGSYLNVGAMWLWREDADHVRFDVGHRVQDVGFVEYESDAQFAPAAHHLATVAAEQISVLRARFPDIHAAARYLRANSGNGGWPAFNAGVALAVAGDAGEATRMWTSLEAGDQAPPWWRAAVERAHQMAAQLAEPDGEVALRQRVADAIRACRAQLKLDPDVSLPWAA